MARALLVLLVLLAVIAPPRRALANMAQPSAPGQVTGILEPQKEHGIRIDSETLTFDVGEDLDRASVEAAYTMTGGAVASSPEVAFAFVRGDDARDVAASVRLDGELVPFRLVTDEVERQKGWSTLAGGRELGFLLFQLSFAPGQTRKVVVAYTQHPSWEATEHVHPVFTFEYLLSPAKSWASFGPLEIVVKAPPRTVFSSPMSALTRDGDRYVAHLPTLPDGELSFEVMSSAGLWLGISRTSTYLGIFVAALALAVGWSGVAIGRRAPRSARGAGAAVLRVVGIAAVGWSVAGAVFVVTSATFPGHGVGYGGAMLSMLLLVVAGPVCVLLSVLGARLPPKAMPGDSPESAGQ
jgi:hypothetical protein